MEYATTPVKMGGEKSCMYLPMEGAPLEGSNKKLVRAVSSAEGNRWLRVRERRETDVFPMHTFLYL